MQRNSNTLDVPLPKPEVQKVSKMLNLLIRWKLKVCLNLEISFQIEQKDMFTLIRQSEQSVSLMYKLRRQLNSNFLFFFF